MNINLHYNDKLRISTKQKKISIDVDCLSFEQGIRVSCISSYTYMEVREKMGLISTFYFSKKSDKKDFNFDWWSDAEVVYSKNAVVRKS